MSNRTQRRAAERVSRQLVVHAGKQTQPITAAAVAGASFDSPESADLLPVSAAELTANRANAQLSRGPVTEAGKAIASLNAVKTGLTGRTVLLPTDDVAIYQQHVGRLSSSLCPKCKNIWR